VTVAVIVLGPELIPVTTPVLLTTVAAAVFDEVQVAVSVTFPVKPLLKVPVAVSCSFAPTASAALGAVMTSEVRPFICPCPVIETTIWLLVVP